MQPYSFFSKDSELSKWGPVPGRYFYISEFEDGVIKGFSSLYAGFRWPNCLFLFNEKRMMFINNLDELKQTGKDVFLKYMINDKKREKIKKQWNKKIKKLSDFEKNIEDIYLNNLSDQELYILWKEFYDLIIDFWPDTVPFEIGNYGSYILLEENLKKYIKDEGELFSVMEILTAPEFLSFCQQEEIDLLKSNDLVKHQKKYFWLRNSYNGVEELQVDFFEKRKKDLLPDIKKSIENRIEGLKKKKRKIIYKYKLSREVKSIIKGLCAGAELQDQKKKHILIYTHYKELFLKEVAKRFGYNVDLLRNCNHIENMNILEKRGTHAIVEKRGNVFGFYMGPLVQEINGGDAVAIWEFYSNENGLHDKKEIKNVINLSD